MEKLIEGGIKIFNAGFNAFLAVVLIAAAVLFSIYCILWVLASNLVNQ